MSKVREIAFRRRQLEALFDRAERLSAIGEMQEAQADYARHLCVLVSGFVEKSMAELIVGYAQDKSPAQIRSYLESSLKRLTNVDKDRLLQVIGSLDARWREELDDYVQDERQAALNSIVGLRNEIAHGGGASVSLRAVRQYWTSIKEVVEKVESLLMPEPRQIRAARGKRAAR